MSYTQQVQEDSYQSEEAVSDLSLTALDADLVEEAQPCIYAVSVSGSRFVGLDGFPLDM